MLNVVRNRANENLHKYMEKSVSVTHKHSYLREIEVEHCTENRMALKPVVLEDENAERKGKDLVKHEGSGILHDHVCDSTSNIVASVFARGRSIWSEVEHWMQHLKERKELRTKIHLQVLDKETSGESSITVHFRIRVGKCCIEELKQ